MTERPCVSWNAQDAGGAPDITLKPYPAKHEHERPHSRVDQTLVCQPGSQPVKTSVPMIVMTIDQKSACGALCRTNARSNRWGSRNGPITRGTIPEQVHASDGSEFPRLSWRNTYSAPLTVGLKRSLNGTEVQQNIQDSDREKEPSSPALKTMPLLRCDGHGHVPQCRLELWAIPSQDCHTLVMKRGSNAAGEL